MFSVATFSFSALPGLLESLHLMASRIDFDFPKAVALFFIPFWMIPFTGWKLIKDIFIIQDSTLKAAKK